jgi:hypothetical protein
MIKNILYGKSGKTNAELNPFHRFTRLAYTFLNVKLHGESWREYRDKWIR